MFNNFINRYDFYDILNKGSKSLPIIFKKLFSTHKKKVESSWEATSYPNDNWWDIPEVLERWNLLMTGDKNVDYYTYTSEKYLSGCNRLIGFSIGCGTGHRELRWVSQGLFSQIDAIDISETRIKYSIEQAKVKGYDHLLNYKVEDIYKSKLEPNKYDIIFIEQSLHHFSPLKELLIKLSNCLKPDGYFIVNEFVGPTRFQWTERQLEIINSIQTLLPAKYKTKLDGKNLKTDITRPSKLRMQLGDPSEAVESSNIIPYLSEVFDVLEMKEYGGTIIHLLFYQIAHNFISDNNLSKRWIKLCFEIEDLLLAEKNISSDYIFAVCKKK